LREALERAVRLPAKRFRNAFASGMMSSRRSRSAGRFTEIALMR
jgi:hypothetical protein